MTVEQAMAELDFMPAKASIEIPIQTLQAYMDSISIPLNGTTIIVKSDDGDKFIVGVDYKAKFDQAADLLVGLRYDIAHLRTALVTAAKDVERVYMGTVDLDRDDIMDGLEHLYIRTKDYIKPYR